jgi:hypothetical protein
VVTKHFGISNIFQANTNINGSMNSFTCASERERSELHCGILYIHWVECEIPTGREVALPISQSSRTWGIFTPSGQLVLASLAMCMGNAIFCPSALHLTVEHSSLNSLQVIRTFSPKFPLLHSNNHTNGQFNRAIENKEELGNFVPYSWLLVDGILL